MRFLVVLVSVGAALTLIAASGLMNFVFMTSLGKSEFEQHILGAVSVAVSAFLALLPTLLVWAWRERRMLYIVLGVPVFLGFAAFSLSSAIGFAAKNRGSISEDRAFAATRLADLRQGIETTEAKLKALGASRPVTVLQESLRGLEQDRRWQSSKECSDATADASRTFCKGYFELKAEAARAAEAALLDERIAGLKRESRHLEEQGAGREADNQAAVLARLLGLPGGESRTRPHALPRGPGRNRRGARALFRDGTYAARKRRQPGQGGDDHRCRGSGRSSASEAQRGSPQANRRHPPRGACRK